MSLADHIFIDMCNDILTNDTSTEGMGFSIKVMTNWPAGPARRARKCVSIGRTAPLPTLLRNSE